MAQWIYSAAVSTPVSQLACLPCKQCPWFDSCVSVATTYSMVPLVKPVLAAKIRNVNFPLVEQIRDSFIVIISIILNVANNLITEFIMKNIHRT